jgi:hypothetical protein
MRPALAIVLACLPALAAPVPKEFKRAAGYHPMAVGDRREYVSPANPDVVTQVREITAVEEKDGAKFFTQKMTSGQTNVLKTDRTGTVWMAQLNEQVHEPPYKVVASDLKDGDRWEVNDGTGAVRTVGKAEKVETPAGTFTALPITISYPNQQGMSEVVVWYAEGVGLVRLDSGGRPSIVLKKYTPGKAAK